MTWYKRLKDVDDNPFKVLHLAGCLIHAAGYAPYLGFVLHEDRIVISCNEDGFTQEKVRAISSIGVSTKNTVQGYIDLH